MSKIVKLVINSSFHTFDTKDGTEYMEINDELLAAKHTANIEWSQLKANAYGAAGKGIVRCGIVSAPLRSTMSLS